MISKSQRSMWRFQCFIILLFNRVSYSPISIRRWSRIDVDAIPLRGSSGFPSFKVETVRSHLSCVIDFYLNVPNLRQISQNQIWDPGLLRLKRRPDIVAEDEEIRRVNLVRYIVDWFSNFSGGGSIPEEDDVSMIQSPQGAYKLTSLMALTLFACWFDPLRLAEPVSITSLWVGWIHFTAITSLISKTPLFENLCFKNLLTKRRLLFYLMVTGAYLFLRKRIQMYGEIDLFFLALVLVEETIRLIRRIRRLNQQHIWVSTTIITSYISLFRRVPKSTVLRCNGWIADLGFRKRKRWYIDKKQMFPKLESHTRLTDETRATKHIFRIAAPNLLCFFVTKIFDCICILMCIITIFGSY